MTADVDRPRDALRVGISDALSPLTLLLAAAVLIGTGLVAGWLPARRAARLDPTSVLSE